MPSSSHSQSWPQTMGVQFVAPQPVLQSGVWTVSFATGAALALAAGTTVGLAAGTTISLAANTMVRQPSIRSFAALGTAGATGIAVSAAVAGAADITAADGTKFRAVFPVGTTFLRVVATSVVGVGVGSVLALSPVDVKATIES